MCGYCNGIYNTYEDALAEAKRHTQYHQHDVTVWESRAITRYPFPEIIVDELVEEPVSTQT
jgi:hypothetical protein